jgi:hypothetical protein
LFFSGCVSDKLDIAPETCSPEQSPGIYFPAYPQSWWIYRNQQNQFVKFEISDKYESFYGKCVPEFLNLIQENHKVYVDGEFFFLDHYAGLGEVLESNSIIYSLIRDSIFTCPVEFSSMYVNHYFESVTDVNARRVTTALDTTVLINSSQTFSDVIIVKEYYTYGPALNHYHFNDYFAKNIGLIKRDSIDEVSHDTTQILSIENYFINH